MSASDTKTLIYLSECCSSTSFPGWAGFKDEQDKNFINRVDILSFVGGVTQEWYGLLEFLVHYAWVDFRPIVKGF